MGKQKRSRGQRKWNMQRVERGRNRQMDKETENCKRRKPTMSCCIVSYLLQYLSNERILLFPTEVPFVLVASVTAQIRFIQLGHAITADSPCWDKEIDWFLYHNPNLGFEYRASAPSSNCWQWLNPLPLPLIKIKRQCSGACHVI